MITAIKDNKIKLQGIEAECSYLGELKSDYTKWQEKLWIDKSFVGWVSFFYEVKKRNPTRMCHKMLGYVIALSAIS